MSDNPEMTGTVDASANRSKIDCSYTRARTMSQNLDKTLKDNDRFLSGGKNSILGTLPFKTAAEK